MTLTGITWDHPRGYDPLIASSLLYEKLFGIVVQWQKRSLVNFGDQSLASLAKQFDLLIIDHPHTGVANKTNCLLPFDDLLPKEKLLVLEQQSAGPSFRSYHYNEKQWALPVDAAMQCSANRPDLLKDMSIPKTWAEAFELSALLKRRNVRVGMALCPTDCLCTFLTLTAQLGSPILEGNELLVNTEVGLYALEMMRKMRDHFHPDCLNWNPIQLYDYMSTMDDIAYSPLAFCYTYYSRDGFRKKRLSYNNAPEINNAVLGGAGIAISANTVFVNEAAAYATWLCSAEIQASVYVKEQGQPGNAIAWKNNFANEITHDFFNNTTATLTHAFVRPRYSGWPAFQQYLGEVLHACLTANTDPLKVLRQLQEAYSQSYKK